MGLGFGLEVECLLNQLSIALCRLNLVVENVLLTKAESPFFAPLLGKHRLCPLFEILLSLLSCKKVDRCLVVVSIDQRIGQLGVRELPLLDYFSSFTLTRGLKVAHDV